MKETFALTFAFYDAPTDATPVVQSCRDFGDALGDALSVLGLDLIRESLGRTRLAAMRRSTTWSAPGTTT